MLGQVTKPVSGPPSASRPRALAARPRLGPSSNGKTPVFGTGDGGSTPPGPIGRLVRVRGAIGHLCAIRSFFNDDHFPNDHRLPREDHLRRVRLLLDESPVVALVGPRQETLAGRVAFHELDGFGLKEVADADRLWLRGGPRSYLAGSLSSTARDATASRSIAPSRLA